MFWGDEWSYSWCVTDPREPGFLSLDSAGVFRPSMLVYTCQLPPLTSAVCEHRSPQGKNMCQSLDSAFACFLNMNRLMTKTSNYEFIISILHLLLLSVNTLRLESIGWYDSDLGEALLM